MNAAARMISQSNLFDGQLTDLQLSRQFILMLCLSFSVLFSAIAVVYTTNTYRTLFSQVEETQQQTHHLQMQWGQLLLEQASLATPLRVGRLAHDKLNMTLPLVKKTFILQSK